MGATGKWYWTFRNSGGQWCNGAFDTEDLAYDDYVRFNKESGIAAPRPAVVN